MSRQKLGGFCRDFYVKTMQGHTFSVKSMQTHDGPGLRTTVFMKGCSLRCKWCHNPESFSPQQEIWRIDEKCINCRLCETSEGTLTNTLNWNGDCNIAHECPSKALELLRTDWTLPELIQRLEREADYWGEGGGVTASGGEPAMQSEFVSSLFQYCKYKNWHTALDTCGAAKPEVYDEMIPFTDLILFDLKMMDSEQHRRWTGDKNEQILENLQSIARFVELDRSKQLWIRTPLIPGATDSIENITAIGEFIAKNLKGLVERWELCSFNNLCTDKYHRLGKTWDFETTPLMEKASANLLLKQAQLFHPKVLLKGRFRK